MTVPTNPPSRPLDALFRPAMVLMVGRMLGFIVSFAIPMILVRIFDQTDFGTYKQLFLIFATLFGVAQMGMAESLYYFLPSQSKNAGRFVVNSIITLGTLGLGSLVGLWLFRFELAELMNNPALAELMLPVGLYLLFMLMAVVLEIIMTVRKQYFAASSTYAITDLGRAIFYLCPLLIVADLRALMVGAVVFALARLVVTLVYVGREFGADLKADRAAFTEQARYALMFGIAGIIGSAKGTFHQFAVSNAFDAATFAIYAVGCLQIPIANYLMMSTSNVLMVSMRERLLAEDMDGVNAAWLDGNRKLALIFFPMVAALIVMAHPFIVLLFTEEYVASVPIFVVWTLSMLLVALLTDSALRVFALNRFLVFENVVALILVVLFLPWSMVEYGLMGAVVVTLLASAVVKVLALERVRRALKVDFAGLLPWKALALTALLSVLAALPAWLLVATLEAPEIVILAVSGPTYVLCYYLLLRRFGPLQADEQEQLSQWVQKPLVWVRQVT